MVKKGVIATLFTLAGLVLAASVALPVCYFLNEQSQSVDPSKNPDVTFVDEEVHLSTDANPLFPGESRKLIVSVSKTIEAECNTSVYFDSFSGDGYEYLSLSIAKGEEEQGVISSIKNATEEKPMTFKTFIGKDTSFSFRYSLSKDVPSTYENLSFSFTMHMRVGD